MDSHNLPASSGTKRRMCNSCPGINTPGATHFYEAIEAGEASLRVVRALTDESDQFAAQYPLLVLLQRKEQEMARIRGAADWYRELYLSQGIDSAERWFAGWKKLHGYK